MPMRSSTRAHGGVDVGLRAPAARSPPARASCARAGAAATRRRASAAGMRSASSRGSRPLTNRAEPQRGAEQRLRQQRAAQPPALRGLGRRATDLVLDDAAADVEQASVLHARRARRLAIAAREAAVEVQLGLLRDRLALEHLLDEVDASARPVELVAQELVRRARRRAEAAVHARAQDRVGLAALGRVAEFRSEIGLHQKSG